jgi:predicted ATP-grasp superfamily ATP-dependent carboligase
MSSELCESAARLGYDVDWAHVREDVEDWVPREVDDIFHDLAKAVSARSREPDAVVNFGRAGVLDGIVRIARAMERLRAEGVVRDGTKLVGPSTHAAEVWGNKALIARSLRELRLPIPKTVEVDADSVANLARQVEDGAFPVPLVVKVVDLTGGVGMRFAGNARELVAAVRELSYLRRPMVASQFVDGDEVSVDLLRLGRDVLVYPPGFKRATDRDLTHADHKIKVNGVVRHIEAFDRDVVRIAESFDLQGFFSLEAVVTRARPAEWLILEGATRVTNNIQMQDASLGIDSFAAVVKYVTGQTWLPRQERLGLALSIPIYRHRGQRSVDELARYDWVRQVKLEDLAQMPDSRDDRTRLTVKMAVDGLDGQLRRIAEATGDDGVPARVREEIARVAATYDV